MSPEMLSNVAQMLSYMARNFIMLNKERKKNLNKDCIIIIYPYSRSLNQQETKLMG